MNGIGAVIGDMAGSEYEFSKSKVWVNRLITARSRATDDSVMTAAVYRAILAARALGADEREPEARRGIYSDYFVREMQAMGRAHPHAGYGGRFRQWLTADEPAPYHSWGNGSAMRVSPCGWAARTLEEARWLGEVSAAVTHDHPEGIRGAVLLSECIFRLRMGEGKEAVRRAAEEQYDMDFTLDGIRESYCFDVSCGGSVPQAVEAFLEGNDFEEVIRLAISIGGDTDTIAAMAGSLAEVIYPIPEELLRAAKSKMPPDLRAVAEQMCGGAFRGSATDHIGVPPQTPQAF